MTQYIVRSFDSEWFVYLSKSDGMSLTGCLEIAHKFQTIEDAEEMVNEINTNSVFKKHKMQVERVSDKSKQIKDKRYGLYKGNKLISVFENELYAKHKAEIYKNDKNTPGDFYIKENK